MIHHALVLTAGLGTRLRPLTDVRAKPAIPVAGEPIVRRIITWLVANGVSDLVLNLHHRPDTLTAVVGDGSDLSARVRYSWEQPTVLGSAGGPRHALPLIDAETFLIVNGDTLTNVDVTQLVAAHTASNALVTLALVPNRAFDRYGGVQVDRGGVVSAFVPRGPSAEGSYHFIGVQVAHASVFNTLSAGVPANSIGGLYDALIEARPGAVRGFVCDADFWDVGTASDYWRTSHAFAGSTVGRGARIDPSACVTDSILWDDVTVDAHAALTECIVTDGTTIPAGAAFTRAIVSSGSNGQPVVTPLTL